MILAGGVARRIVQCCEIKFTKNDGDMTNTFKKGTYGFWPKKSETALKMFKNRQLEYVQTQKTKAVDKFY